MKRILAYNILFLFFYLACFSQKGGDKSMSIETFPPEWVSKRPISASKYIGIGVAPKIGNPNCQFEAKKNALYDLSSEIKVNISSNSMLYSVQNTNQFSQTYSSIINLKSIENIEGYQLVEAYENEKQCWAYYELDKQAYLDQKAQKKKNIVSKAAELIKLSLNDIAQKNYMAGLRKKIQAFSILVPYLNEEIDFSEYKISNIKNIFDLTREMQLELQSIGIQPPVNTPVLKPYQQKYSPIAIKAYTYKDLLVQFPFTCFYDDEIIQAQDKSVSNDQGVLDIVPLYVQANFMMTNIQVQPDIEALMQNDSASSQNVKFLMSFIQVPKFSIQISIQPISVFIQTRENNMNKPINSAVIKNLLFSKMKTNEINIVNDSTQADYMVKVYSNTSEDENSEELKKQFNLYLAKLSVDISLYNKDKQILFSQTIDDVYGYGSNMQISGSSAYNSEKLVSRLNELIFYLKRKIVWY